MFFSVLLSAHVKRFSGRPQARLLHCSCCVHSKNSYMTPCMPAQMVTLVLPGGAPLPVLPPDSPSQGGGRTLPVAVHPHSSTQVWRGQADAGRRGRAGETPPGPESGHLDAVLASVLLAWPGWPRGGGAPTPAEQTHAPLGALLSGVKKVACVA